MFGVGASRYGHPKLVKTWGWKDLLEESLWLNIDGQHDILVALRKRLYCEVYYVFTVNFMVKPNGLLVTVSLTYLYAYTSVLSTWWSSTALISLRLGNLILRKASCLHAFSTYPNRISLRSGAAGATTPSQPSQEVRSSRSSCTEDKPLKSPAPTFLTGTTELAIDVLNPVHVPL